MLPGLVPAIASAVVPRIFGQGNQGGSPSSASPTGSSLSSSGTAQPAAKGAAQAAGSAIAYKSLEITQAIERASKINEVGLLNASQQNQQFAQSLKGGGGATA